MAAVTKIVVCYVARPRPLPMYHGLQQGHALYLNRCARERLWGKQEIRGQRKGGQTVNENRARLKEFLLCIGRPFLTGRRITLPRNAAPHVRWRHIAASGMINRRPTPPAPVQATPFANIHCCAQVVMAAFIPG